MITNLLTKLFLILVVTSLLFPSFKILNYCLLQKWTKEKMKSMYSKKELEKIKQNKAKRENELEDLINYKEIKPYSLEARQKFNELMKEGKLSREQILFIKKTIDEYLADYRKNYSCYRFKNDAHEIYSKLKSSHLSKDDYEEIIEYMDMLV